MVRLESFHSTSYYRNNIQECVLQGDYGWQWRNRCEAQMGITGYYCCFTTAKKKQLSRKTNCEHSWNSFLRFIGCDCLNIQRKRKTQQEVTVKQQTKLMYLKKEHFIKTKCLFTRPDIILLLEKALYLYKMGRIMHTQPAWEWHICISAVIAYYSVNSPSSFTLLHYNRTYGKTKQMWSKMAFGIVWHVNTVEAVCKKNGGGGGHTLLFTGPKHSSFSRDRKKIFFSLNTNFYFRGEKTQSGNIVSSWCRRNTTQTQLKLTKGFPIS